MVKERLNLNEAFDDPETIKRSFDLFKKAGTLKPEDYYQRFTI